MKIEQIVNLLDFSLKHFYKFRLKTSCEKIICDSIDLGNVLQALYVVRGLKDCACLLHMGFFQSVKLRTGSSSQCSLSSFVCPRLCDSQPTEAYWYSSMGRSDAPVPRNAHWNLKENFCIHRRSTTNFNFDCCLGFSVYYLN